MLHLYHANRAERLLDQLLPVCAQGDVDPFVAETVVVQNQGMARWLSQQMALRAGIAANLEFPLPASFIWRVFEAWFGEQPSAGAFEREALRWRCMARLPDLLDEPAFEEVAGYLHADRGRRELYNLCGRVADVFDQYLVYRPDWIIDWEGGQGEHWQARLWRAIALDQAGAHRARLLLRLREAVGQGLAPVGALPERISLFGMTAMAPAYLEVLEAVSRHADVHVFLLNPSREYWSDIVDERSQARRRARWRREEQPDLSSLLDVGNPLLASLGHAGQEFLDQLLELNPLDVDDFEPAGGSRLLEQLQDDILDLQDRRAPLPEQRIGLDRDDTSVCVQVCHSALREVQVLHDRLLDLFAKQPDLTPRDVIVMAPDIDEYAPYVDAVFGAASPYIPWSIADRRLGAEQPVLDALEKLLRLPLERLTASWVLSLLEIPAVAARFEVDEGGLERLRVWIAESGVRWGLDAADRAVVGLPEDNTHSWDFGMARLFLGYAMPTDADLFQDIAPYTDIEGGEAVYLGALQDFLERLGAWRARLRRPATAPQWQERIHRLLEEFLLPDGEADDALQAVRLAMDALRKQAEEAGFETELELDTVHSHLRAALQETSGARRFLTGRVTFCNMVPMRGIPFSVICLLGMNDGQFPRVQRPLGFDLIAAHPRRGDRSRRRDDRYLFLEALLSARRVFYLSYQGRDARDNSERQPSVVVGELLDYAERAYRIDGVDELRRQLCVVHPLQPFSPRYFDAGSAQLFSYARDWLSAARGGAEAPAIFAPQAVTAPRRESDEVEIGELLAFFRLPAAYFLRHRLGLRLFRDENALEDDEPFSLDPLQRYRLEEFHIAGLLQGRTGEQLGQRWRAAGELPHGLIGEQLLEKHSEGLADFAERIRAAGGEPLEPLEVTLPIGDYRLTGRLDGLSRDGQLLWRSGILRPKDRVEAWIRHLLLNACASAVCEPVTRFLAKDLLLTFQPLAEAAGQLQDLLTLWELGQRRPLPFFPATSWTFFVQEEMSNAVYKAWNDRWLKSGDGREPAARIAFRDVDPLGEEFRELAQRVFEPLKAAMEETKVSHS